MVVLENIKGPTHMAEGDRHLRKTPTSTHLNMKKIVHGILKKCMRSN